jgi:hypothetical protein
VEEEHAVDLAWEKDNDAVPAFTVDRQEPFI